MKATLKIKKKMAQSGHSQKTGRDYVKYNLLVESSKGSFYVSCFENAVTKEWKEGDTVDMDLSPWTDNKGVKQWNAKPYEVSNNEIFALLTEIRNIIKGVQYKDNYAPQKKTTTHDDDPAPMDEPEEDSVPF